MSPVAPEFLTVADALHVHRSQIDTFGGEHGVRDMGLLESAMAQPRATYGGAFLHPQPFGMAAAYLYHIVRNHPFLDGNKRTGAVLALVFLDWNGVTLRADNDGLAGITLRVAEGRAGKEEIAEFFQSIACD
jgi:death-on-curing protein